MITFQYRLFPDNKQQALLWKHANKLNNLYNYFLDQRITAYKNKTTKVGRKEQQAELVVLKKDDKVLQEMHSQVIQQSTLRLDKSYKAFFERIKKGGPPGFPKFRACRDFFGICYPQSGYTIENSIFITKAYGKISFKQHRNIQGNIKQVNVSCKNNRYYLNITTDASSKQSAKIAEVGIDIGLKNLVVTSDGKKIANCTHAKYFDKQIAKVQSRADKLTKGSNKQKFLSKVKRRLCGAKVRKINDFQHKVSRNLARQYDTVYAEDLSVKNMSESRITNLNKAIRNAKFGQFLNFLGYKVNKLVLVNPVNTSKTCNPCGNIHHNLKLSDRVITCSKCGAVYDRDENAAKNVFCLGQAIATGQYGQSLTIDEALAFRRG